MGLPTRNWVRSGIERLDGLKNHYAILSERQIRSWSERMPRLAVWIMEYRTTDGVIRSRHLARITDDVFGAIAFARRWAGDVRKLASNTGLNESRYWDTRTNRYCHDWFGRIRFEPFSDFGPENEKHYGMTWADEDQEGVLEAVGFAELVVLSPGEARIFFRRVCEEFKANCKGRDGARWADYALERLQ